MGYYRHLMLLTPPHRDRKLFPPYDSYVLVNNALQLQKVEPTLVHFRSQTLTTLIHLVFLHHLYSSICSIAFATTTFKTIKTTTTEKISNGVTQ